MSTRAEALAAQYETAVAEAVAAIEACSDAQWRATSRDEGWPVRFVGWHIGNAPGVVLDLVTMVANGKEPPPMTSEMLDGMNAEKLARHGNAGKAEVLDQLRRTGATVAKSIRTLSDEQLDRSAKLAMVGGRSMSAQQLIENGMINHIRAHVASMQAATGAGAAV